MSIRFFAIIFLLLTAFSPLHSNAAEINGKVARWYKVYWKKVHIADLKVEVDAEGMTSEIQSYGAVKTISKYSNNSTTKFHTQGDSFAPSYHHSFLTQRQGDKKVTINYDENGKITKESVVPPDKAYKRPPVKNESKIGAVDPLTAAVVAHEKIKAALISGEKTFSYNIYDGRRLAKIDFKIEGKDNIKVLDKNQDVVKISFRRSAIEGFTNNELKRMKGEEPDVVVYLGAEDLLPVKAEAAAPLGKAIIVMEKECESIAKCK